MLLQEIITSNNWKHAMDSSSIPLDVIGKQKTAQLKTREIIMRSDIPKGNWVQIFTGGTILASPNASSNYCPKRDINEWMLGNLQNTKDIIFSILDRETWEIQSLEIPIVLSERLGEYLRNRYKIETNEQYRLPGGLKNYPVNCESFVHYIEQWFDKKPKLSFEYIKNEALEASIVAGDILYLHEWDEWTGEYWHYMIYIGEGFCISKNGGSHLVITRHHLRWLYRIIEK